MKNTTVDVVNGCLPVVVAVGLVLVLIGIFTGVIK